MARKTPPRRPSAVGAQRTRRGSPWTIAAPLLAAVAAFTVFAQTLSFQFLNWDDDRYVLQNPWIRSWSAENLIHIFTKPYFANFLPLHLLSYMFDYSLWGLNPFGYHLQSVLLHALNAALVWMVVRRMFGGRTLPFLAALFFAVNPAHVEAVAWISIRKDLLSTTFALASLDLYLRARAAPSRDGGLPAAYVGSVLCFTLALLAKVTAVTLPAFFLLLDWTRGEAKAAWQRRLRGSDLTNKIPFVLIGASLVVFNRSAQVQAGAILRQDALSHAMVKGHAMWNYLGLLFGFLHGNPDYDLPALARDPATLAASLAGWMALPLAAWLAYRAKNRTLLLGVSWIFIALIPALGFPIVTYMADRYLYLPSIGFCWIVAYGIAWVGGRVRDPRSRRLALAGLALVPFILFVGRTLQYLPVWRDSESLWTYAMTRSHDYRPYTNLAQIRIQQNRLEEAEKLLLFASQDHEDPYTYENLSAVYFRLGRYPEAVQAAERALRSLRQSGWDSVQASGLYYNEAAGYAMMGDKARAIEALQAAVRENPGNAEARAKLTQLGGNPSP
jgi:tetratricopeptide (TPR) repeat protein